MADFKVRCVDDSGNCFTKGKIYDVVDGVITYDYISGTMPKLDQIQEFDLVKLRNGFVYFVVSTMYGLDIVNIANAKSKMNREKPLFRDITNDLKNRLNEEYDIIAYRHFTSHRKALYYFVAEKEPSWD